MEISNDKSYNYTSEDIRNILKNSVEINITEKNNPDLFYWLCVLNQIFIWADSKKQVLEQWMYIMGTTNDSRHQRTMRFQKKYSNITGNMRHFTSWSLSYSNKVNHVRDYYLIYEHYQNDGKKDKPMITLEDKYSKKSYYPFWAYVTGFERHINGYRCSNIIEFIIMLCYVEYDWDYNYTKECLERSINLIEPGTKFIKNEYINNFSVDEWCIRAYDKMIVVNESYPQVSWSIYNLHGNGCLVAVTSNLNCERDYKDKDKEHHYFNVEIKTKDEEQNEPSTLIKFQPNDRTKIKFLITDNSINVSVV